MNKRPFLTLAISLSFVAAWPVQAYDLSKISNREAVTAFRTTLQKGADAAISSLGQANGFLGNPEVKILLPQFLNDNKGLFKMLGMGPQLNSMEQSMNRAAEAAIPQAKAILKKTITNVSVTDAKSLLAGNETAVTDFLREKTSGDLHGALLPLIRKETAKFDLANQYNALASKGSRFGLIDESQANFETYVTNEALEGLFYMIGKEEKAIRADPLKAGSDLLKRIFSKN